MMTSDPSSPSVWQLWSNRGGLKLRHLRTVLEVADARSIGAAAKAMHVSQPAVTKALHEVEHAAGMALFERSPEGTAPTPAGHAVVRYAREVFGTIERAGSELDAIAHGFEESLAIGCNFPSAVKLLPEAVLLLCERYPKVSVTVREAPLEVLLPELRMRELDVLIARWPSDGDSGDLVEHARFSQPMAVVGSADHPLVRRGAATWRDLARCRWLLPPRASVVRRELDALLRAKGIAVQPLQVDSSSPAANAVLVKHWQAVTIVPEALLASTAEALGLRRIRVSIPATAFSPNSAFTLAGREIRPCEDALLRCLREVGGGPDRERRMG